MIKSRSCILAAAAAALLLAVPEAPAQTRPASSQKGRRQAIDLLSQGRQHEEQGQVDAAIALYRQSLETAPSPAAYYQLGHALATQGDKAQAKQAYEQALAMNPGFELARLELGQLNGGAAAPSSAGGQAVNIDRLRSENETMQSLDVPNSLLAAGASEPAPSNSYGDLMKRMIPGAPSNPDAGRPPQPTTFQPTGQDGNRAYDAAFPPQTTIIENNDTAVVIETGNAPPDRRGRPATPAEVGEVMGEATGPSPSAGIIPSRVGPAPAEGGGTAAAAGGERPTAESINAAAFSPESAQDPGSIVYGSHSKVFLGTFAFHKDKGDQYRETDRWPEAAEEYKTALELAPGDVDTRTLYAEALARSGRVAEAENQFAKAENMSAGDSRVLYRRGNMYRESGRTDLALGSYLEAVEVEPRNLYALNNIGVIYMEKSEYERAARYFKRVLEIDPVYDKALLNLGIIYDDHIVDEQQALQYYDRYLKTNGQRKNEVVRWADAIRGQ